jgi:Flp pilus assembly protein TadD
MQAPSTHSATKRSGLTKTLMAMTALVLVTGCASNKSNTGTHSPASGTHYSNPGSAQARAAVSKWGSAYEKDRTNRMAILGYSDALSRNGQTPQAMAVLRAGVIAHPKDREIASAYGKVLAMNGRFDEAMNVLKGAQRPDTPDWKLMSAKAAIYDQMGEHKKARSIYKQALQIAPDDPSLLNNLGLSYLLSNELPDAEYTCAVPRPFPAQTAACVKTWRLSSVSRANMMRPFRWRGQNWTLARRKPTSPISDP